MKLIVFFFYVLVGSISYGQIISQFTWETNPVTTADIGPDATSVSGSATTDVGGVGGTRGLNAGLPKADINMIIPGSPTFDVAGIDVSFDFHREESQCDWFRRGNSLIMDGSNQFSVSYRVDDGAGGFNTVTSGNQFNIPNDDTYRNYRFIYLPATGMGLMLVDGVIIWSNDGPDNRDMYWTGAGDVTIGSGCDGTGNNDTFMDNLIIGSVINSGLPIELYEMTATATQSNTVEINWITKSETDNDYFTLERSEDGQNWHEIATVDGAGNSSMELTYRYEDFNPFGGVSYYRLKQTDYNGDFEYFSPVSVFIASENPTPYPNPAQQAFFMDVTGVKDEHMVLYNSMGQVVPFQKTEQQGRTEISLSDLPPGIYLFTILTSGDMESFRIIKE